MKFKIAVLVLMLVNYSKAQTFEKGYETILNSILPMLYTADGVVFLPGDEKGEEDGYQYASFYKEDGIVTNNAGYNSKLNKIAWNKRLDYAQVYDLSCNSYPLKLNFIEWNGDRITKFRTQQSWALEYDDATGEVIGMKRTDYSVFGKDAESNYYTIHQDGNKQVIRLYNSVGKGNNGQFEEKYSYVKTEKIIERIGNVYKQTITNYQDKSKKSSEDRISSVQVKEFDLGKDDIVRYKEMDNTGKVIFDKEFHYNSERHLLSAVQVYNPDNKKTMYSYVLNDKGLVSEGSEKQFDSSGERINFFKRIYTYDEEDPCKKAKVFRQEIDENNVVIREFKDSKFREKIDGKWSDWDFVEY